MFPPKFLTSLNQVLLQHEFWHQTYKKKNTRSKLFMDFRISDKELWACNSPGLLHLSEMQLLVFMGFYNLVPICLFSAWSPPDFPQTPHLSSQDHSLLPQPFQKLPLVMKLSQPKMLPPQTSAHSSWLSFLMLLPPPSDCDYVMVDCTTASWILLIISMVY